MATNRTLQWHSIAKLPLIAHHIDGMLVADTEQYQTLQKARVTTPCPRRPYCKLGKGTGNFNIPSFRKRLVQY
jgi:hypothetical protein